MNLSTTSTVYQGRGFAALWLRLACWIAGLFGYHRFEYLGPIVASMPRPGTKIWDDFEHKYSLAYFGDYVITFPNKHQGLIPGNDFNELFERDTFPFVRSKSVIFARQYQSWGRHGGHDYVPGDWRVIVSNPKHLFVDGIMVDAEFQAEFQAA